MERLAAEVKACKYHNILKDAGRIVQDNNNKMGDPNTEAQTVRRAEISSLRMKFFVV